MYAILGLVKYGWWWDDDALGSVILGIKRGAPYGRNT